MAAKTATGTYRRFEIAEDETAFLITEIEPSKVDPMYLSGCGWKFFGLKSTWNQARTQAKPVFVQTLEGGMQELGVIFDPAAYEQACYQGYVGYGLSMSDGFYAPLRFEGWVASLRADAKRSVTVEHALFGSDVGPVARNAWSAYCDAVQANPNL